MDIADSGATPRQQEILDYIILFHEERKVSPTMREIAKHFGIAINAVAGHVRSLKKKRLLLEISGTSRSLVPAPPLRCFDLILISRPKAWNPMAWDEEPPPALVVGVEMASVSEKAADAFMFEFNSQSLDKQGSLWLVKRKRDPASLRDI